MSKEQPQPTRTYTYDEIAKELGVTRSAVHKIEQRALRKLRKALKEKGIELDDLI